MNTNPEGNPKAGEEKCIYLVRGKVCGLPATHFLQKSGSRRRRHYCATHADWVKQMVRGQHLVEAL